MGYWCLTGTFIFTIDYSSYLFRVILFAVAHLAKFLFVCHPFLILGHSILLRLPRWQRRRTPGGPAMALDSDFFHVASNRSWRLAPEYPHLASLLPIFGIASPHSSDIIIPSRFCPYPTSSLSSLSIWFLDRFGVAGSLFV